MPAEQQELDLEWDLEDRDKRIDTGELEREVSDPTTVEVEADA